jgi:acyl carrier protein
MAVLSETEALTVIRDVVASVPDLRIKSSPAEVQAATRFREDLGYDSLARAMLFYELQERFPHLEEAAAVGWKTVGDCMVSLRQK